MNRTPLPLLSLLIAIFLAPWLSPAVSSAQTMLVPVAADYKLGGFHYSAPALDGWRQLTNAKDALELVYAEQLDDKINSRCFVTIRAFDIEDPANVSTPQALAELSRDQQMKARGENLAAYTPVAKVPGDNDLYAFTLVTKLPQSADKPETKLTEAFWITMAPDKSQYLVLHLISQEDAVPTQLYFQQFYGSLVSVKYSPDEAGGAKASAAEAAEAAPSAAASGGAAPGAAAAPEGEGAAEGADASGD